MPTMPRMTVVIMMTVMTMTTPMNTIVAAFHRPQQQNGVPPERLAPRAVYHTRVLRGLANAVTGLFQRSVNCSEEEYRLR